MPLSAGARLGPYEVVSPLGAGGMGEVYRARDTRVDRPVALKVLPEEFFEDEERRARFGREAKLLASLNHPGIAVLYSFEESSGRHLLSMELVEGEDLAGRLTRGALPVEEAISIAKQIAEALEAAHEKGIVHRDLKPANVKTTPDGRVKLLDFGLAKIFEADGAGGSAPSVTRSPTLTARATAAGVIMGTAAYMSPEQARGKAVDKRTDVWAFGCVLYEMLAGRRVFKGETVSDTLAAVLKEDPDWAALPAGTPEKVKEILRKCLRRDLRARLHDIADARLDIEELSAPGAMEGPEPEGSRAAASGYRLRPTGFWLAIAAACLVVGLAGGALLARRSSSRPLPQRPVRTLVLPSPGRALDDSQAISPNGEWVAYTAGRGLWIRSLGELEAREVPDSRGAIRPFWSPHSDAVAFAAGDRILRVSLQAGRPVELCRFTGGDFTGGSWSAVKGIVFTLARANWDGEVLRVPEGGGRPETFTRADPKKGERRLHDPHFLPDGRSLLYTVVTKGANEGDIAVDREGARTQLGLGNGASQPAWSPTGHVVFTRRSGLDDALWALPFALEALAPTGDAFRIAVGGSNASVSADGTLVYGWQKPEPQQLVWVDRAGKTLGTIGEPLRSTLWNPAVSPDGRRVAANVNWERLSVWDTERGVETRVSGESERVGQAGWLPGGEEIAYGARGEALRVRRADGSGEPRVLLKRAGVASPSYSRDGAYVAFYVVDPETGRDLWAMATKKPDEPFLLLRTKANEALPEISPDGKFVVYESDASGRWEVYVQPFPRGEGRWQVSAGAGQHPLWNPRGGELFFVSGNDLMAVDVAIQPQFRVGVPHRLFGGGDVGTSLSLPRYIERFYGAAPDGRRFAVVRGVAMGTSDVVLVDGAFARARIGNERAEKGNTP
ncbi:MAG: protein kinase domain-containing protein [Thermoanaerobaculia bacterium]